MKPSERMKDVLPSCLELWKEKGRQAITTNSFAPSKEEFQHILDHDPLALGIGLGILVDAYASAILHVMDEDYEATQRQFNQIWNKLRDMNGGPLPGDP